MRRIAVGLSVGIHAALLITMSALPDRHSVAATKLVEMTVRTPAPPPPIPPPPEPEKKDEPPPPTIRPKLVKKRTVEKIVADEPPPPLEPEKPKPPPSGFAVDMSNTTNEGQVAVPAVDGASNMFGKQGEPPPEPGTKVKSPQPPPPKSHGRGTAGANAGYQITRNPQFLGNEAERRPPYPRSAMEREIEGSVLLDVYVGVSGRVERVRVVQRLDPSCDEIAIQWAKEHWRFKPAMAGDQPVGMWIAVPVRFELER